MRGLSLDQLQTFADVVELGSFSAAARRLNLTQPAVSLQIKHLESRLGVRLVERVGRRAHPTAAGRDLLAHVQHVDAAITGALAAVAEHREGGIGRLRLGTGATACIYLLPPVLRALRQKFPALEIVVSTGNSPEILAALEGNAIDVALVTLPAPGRSLQVVWTRDDEMVAIFPPGAASLPARITADFLAERPLVLYEAGGHARRVIDDWFMRAGVAAKPIMELGSVEAIKKLVGAGMGCAVLPRLALEHDPAKWVPVFGKRSCSKKKLERDDDSKKSHHALMERSGDKLVPRPLSPRLHRKLALVLRRDKQLDRSLRAFVKTLTALG